MNVYGEKVAVNKKFRMVMKWTLIWQFHVAVYNVICANFS